MAWGVCLLPAMGGTFHPVSPLALRSYLFRGWWGPRGLAAHRDHRLKGIVGKTKLNREGLGRCGVTPNCPCVREFPSILCSGVTSSVTPSGCRIRLPFLGCGPRGQNDGQGPARPAAWVLWLITSEGARRVRPSPRWCAKCLPFGISAHTAVRRAQHRRAGQCGLRDKGASWGGRGPSSLEADTVAADSASRTLRAMERGGVHAHGRGRGTPCLCCAV